MANETLWINPVGIVTGDRSVRVTYPSVSQPHVTVSVREPGDFKWLYLPISIPVGRHINALRVCYRIVQAAHSSRTIISQLRLAEVRESDEVLVRHDDPTDLVSTEPTCYRSAVSGFELNGTLTLAMRLRSDGPGDKIVLMAVGIDYAVPTVLSSAAIFNVRDFGARGDGTTDDFDAFQRAIEAISALSGLPAGDPLAPSAILYVPTGQYRMRSSLRLHQAVTIQGTGPRGSRLVFDPGLEGSGSRSAATAGVIFDMRLRDPDDHSLGYAALAQASVIRDLSVEAIERFHPPVRSSTGEWVFRGPPGWEEMDDDEPFHDGTFSGIVLYTRAQVENCSILGFRHDGIHINTSAGFGRNANGWRVQNCFTQSNGRHGMYVSGGDANAGLALSVHALSNVRWGIYDRSFLGNTYVGCLTETNGHIHPRDEGDPFDSFGGGYRTTNPNARHVMLGCYAESDQINRIIFPTMIIGGNNQGHGWENDVAVRRATRIHNEGNAELYDLRIQGPFTTNVARMRTIATGAPQDIRSDANIILAEPGPLSLELRLPPKEDMGIGQLSIGQRITIKKVDDTSNPVVITATASTSGGVPTPTIDGRARFELAIPYSFVTVVFDGENWNIVGQG
jgi:Pectate lyase superfamily protein